MAGLIERYDSALIGILQSEGQIAKFLDVVFGFLYRKTDFFLIMKEKDARMGFPEGVALKLAVGAFKKYETLAAQMEKRRQKQAEALKRKALEEKEKQGEKQEEKFQEELAKEHPMLDPNKEVREEANATKQPKLVETKKDAVEAMDTEVKTSPQAKDNGGNNGDQSTTEKPPKSAESKEVTVEPESAHVENKPHAKDQLDNAAATKSSNVTKEGENENKTGAKENEKKKASSSDVDEDNPELTAQQKVFQANPDSYNGAVRDNYAWSQSISDVDVHIKVPKWVRKGADVRVEINKKHLKASHKDKNGSFVLVVDEPLTWDINKEESMWSLVPGEHIHVNLEKIQERWWEALLESEPKISVRKIDPSRPMTDLDDEAQAKIEEMMFNEHQKRIGKPQSHELKVHDMLKNAWDLEGSPFKGQPFDPSVLNIQNPGQLNMGGPPPKGPSS